MVWQIIVPPFSRWLWHNHQQTPIKQCQKSLSEIWRNKNQTVKSLDTLLRNKKCEPRAMPSHTAPRFIQSTKISIKCSSKRLHDLIDKTTPISGSAIDVINNENTHQMVVPSHTALWFNYQYTKTPTNGSAITQCSQIYKTTQKQPRMQQLTMRSTAYTRCALLWQLWQFIICCIDLHSRRHFDWLATSLTSKYIMSTGIRPF